MLWFLKAGLVAAGRQLVAVLLIALLASLLTPHIFAVQEMPAMSRRTEGYHMSFSQLLTWMYLLFAVGFIFTSGRSIDLTAKRIHYASRLVRSVPRGYASTALVTQFSIAAVLFAVFALRTPPQLLLEGSRYFGYADAASIGWAGLMSIGMACFGASAHAALKSV